MEVIDTRGKTGSRSQGTTKGAEVKFTVDYQVFIDRKSTLNQNLLKAFALIYGNYCTKIMQTKLQHLPDFTDDIRGDPILLLKSIQILMHDPVRGRYPFASVADAWRTLFFTKQSEGEDILDYSKRFKQNRDVVKAYMGDEMFHHFIEKTKEYREADKRR